MENECTILTDILVRKHTINANQVNSRKKYNTKKSRLSSQTEGNLTTAGTPIQTGTSKQTTPSVDGDGDGDGDEGEDDGNDGNDGDDDDNDEKSSNNW